MHEQHPSDSGKIAPGPLQPGSIELVRFDPGPFQTNCYVIRSQSDPGCWIVDAGFEPEDMIRWIRQADLEPKALILTHAHIDHIAGIPAVRKAFPGLPIWMHAAEADWLPDPERNLSAAFGEPVSYPAPDRTLAPGDAVQTGAARWQVIHVPGHSPGSIALYCPELGVAIAGDALFAGSIGRTDLPGGDHDLLLRMIKERLYPLPDQTRILPGHGPETTIGREKRSNPFVRG